MQILPRLHREGSRSIAVLLLGCSLVAACEEPFEPIAESDLAFSIYGNLDAGADTQWVRVMPIRASLETLPDAIDAVVTLEEIETGMTVQMSDSVFRFQPRFLGETDLYAHNFSTTMPIVPGRQYRLTATRSDGASATATVRIPTFESPTMQVIVGVAPTVQGNIRGTRYLAMVLGREIIPPECQLPLPFHQEFLPVTTPARSADDDHRMQLSWPILGPRPSYVSYPPPCDMEAKRVLAIATPEPWQFPPTMDDRLLTHMASAVDNVEGDGLGFLAGIYTHVFPYDVCSPAAGRISCTVTFSPRSATLVGLALNGCTGEPIAPVTKGGLPKQVRVELRGPPDGGIRYDTTDLSGVFRFEGVEPGEPYSLSLEQLPQFEFGVEVPSEFIPVDIDGVVLQEAAVDTLTIVMARRKNCPVM